MNPDKGQLAMTEAADTAWNLIRRADGKPPLKSMDEARAWVKAQWPDWSDWIGVQMLDNTAEAVFNTTATEFPVYAYTFHTPTSPPAYVSALPGDGGADWGYTNRIEGNRGFDKALPLSKFHWQRFAKACRDCNRAAFAIPAAVRT
jgi:hypothetical protein